MVSVAEGVCSITTLAHGPALLMRQEEISFSFAQAPSLTPSPSVSPASLKMDPTAQTVGVGVGVFGPGGIPGPVLDNCLTVSAFPPPAVLGCSATRPRL